MKIRHILGISGGKDSAALAIYLKQKYPNLNIEYYNSDTGCELAETDALIDKLEAYLGKIKKLKAAEGSPEPTPFHHFLKAMGGFLPSPQSRWCTKKMKLEKLEEFVGNDLAISYVGIRGDENRDGFISNNPNIQAIFPFRKNIWSIDVVNKFLHKENLDQIVSIYERLCPDGFLKKEIIETVKRPPEPWQREINPNENYEYTIKHPCLVNTEADFERARRKVNEGAEPWISGWQKLCDSRFAQLNYNSNPQEEIVRHSKGGNFNTAAFDAGAAYQLALRWKISGDEDYAKAAIKILNGWAKTCKGVNYKTWPDDSHRLLAAGFIGYQFAAPAELMRDYEGWKTEDFEIFKKWIDKTFYPICDDFLDNHFNSSAIAGWMSWDLPAMLTILSIGVLNDDDAKIKQALEFFYHGKGMGCIEWSVRGMHEDPEGKVKGRHLAQSQEMGRDQGHATLNVSLHAYFCRTAYNMGIDLFAYNDNIVLDLCEYTAKYNLTSAEDVEMPFEPYYPEYAGADFDINYFHNCHRHIRMDEVPICRQSGNYCFCL